MTFASFVGPQELPLAADAGKLGDHVVEALLPYLAFCLNDALNAKLALLTGTSAEAVPSGHTFAWDPTEPRGHVVKLPVPALFLWWTRESQLEQLGPLLWQHTRSLRLAYVFDELPGQDALDDRTGLFPAASVALIRAAVRDRHPGYAPPGKPAGTEVTRSIGRPDSWAWQCLGCVAIPRFGIDEQRFSRRGRSAQASGRDYPALAASLRVQEMLGPEEADVVRDGLATITAEGGAAMFDRELLGADGSEISGW